MGLFKSMDLEIRFEVLTNDDAYSMGYNWANKFLSKGISIDYLKGCLENACEVFKKGAHVKFEEYE